MLNAPLLLKRLSDPTIEQNAIRVVVFALMLNLPSLSVEYLFALPVGAVVKIIPCPPINGMIEDGIGIADIGSQTVTIVDLRQKLVPLDLEKQVQDSLLISSSSRFLILLKTQAGELCGIPVEQPPTLTDIPLAAIHAVPLSYRQVSRLSWASHMAILPTAQEKETLKIFLLGMSQILAHKLA